MKRNSWILALAVLLAATLACSLFSGRSAPLPSAPPSQAQPATEPATEAQATEAQAPENAPVGSGEANDAVQNFETEFPVPPGVTLFTDMGNGSINIQAKIELKEAISFYRDSFGKLGYQEREINTAITESTFSLVFDGHASGKAIIVQGVDLGGGNTNISIRFEDI